LYIIWLLPVEYSNVFEKKLLPSKMDDVLMIMKQNGNLKKLRHLFFQNLNYFYKVVPKIQTVPQNRIKRQLNLAIHILKTVKQL
jgi:hypothetical protein